MVYLCYIRRGEIRFQSQNYGNKGYPTYLKTPKGRLIEEWKGWEKLPIFGSITFKEVKPEKPIPRPALLVYKLDDYRIVGPQSIGSKKRVPKDCFTIPINQLIKIESYDKMNLNEFYAATSLIKPSDPTLGNTIEGPLGIRIKVYKKVRTRDYQKNCRSPGSIELIRCGIHCGFP